MHPILAITCVILTAIGITLMFFEKYRWAIGCFCVAIGIVAGNLVVSGSPL